MSDPLIPPTPLAHFEGQLQVMSWTPEEGFFFDPEHLVGQRICAAAMDEPEPGCLRLDFVGGGGVIINVGLKVPEEDLQKARHLALVRGWKDK